jgi:hypothetical protein
MAERREKRSTGRGSKSTGSRGKAGSQAKSTGKRRTSSQSRSTGTRKSAGSQSKSTGARKTTRSQSKSSGTRKTTRSQSKSTATKRSTRSQAKAPASERSESASDERIRGTAPSAADITKLDNFEASEEAKQHEPSAVDAMGQDKRREVVGHSYGPSKRSQIMFFVAVATVLVVVVGGWIVLVNAFDNPPENFSERAPWSTTPNNPELAAEQNARPVSPGTPCGEPGNEYPIPSASPCAPPSKANDFQGSSTGQ